jgi:uncharacterized membrane protein
VLKLASTSPVRGRRAAHQAGVAPRPTVRLRAALSIDLVLVVVVALFATGTVLLDGPIPARVVLGLPPVLFLPGYAVVSALFPGADDVDGAERIALGFGLSLATIALIALVLDNSQWSVAQAPFSVALLSVTAVAAVVGGYRRTRRPTPDRYQLAFRLPRIPPPRTWRRTMRVEVGLLALAMILLAVGGASAVYVRIAGPALTEFALYNDSGSPSFYPRQIVVGQPAEVRLSVTNRERRTVSYAIAMSGAGAALDPLPVLTLADGETRTETIRFTVTQAGEQLPVQFELWRGDASTTTAPYRSLRLMIDGLEPDDRSGSQPDD